MIAGTPKAEQLIQDYRDQVAEGLRATCALERAAIARHDHDLVRAEAGDVEAFPYRFDDRLAFRYIDLIPHVVQHSTGKWEGEPFCPSPWQAWILYQLLGWRNVLDATRRFQKAYVTMGRKNGKTFFAATVTILIAYLDKPFEPRAEIYTAATKESQAKLTWDEARRIIERSPSLRKHAKIRPSRNVIELPGKPWNETIIKPVGADGRRQDGFNPTLVIKDEYHAWTPVLRDLDEKLSTGGASRQSPLELVITTAGDEDSVMWRELDDFASRVVTAGGLGQPLDDRQFVYIARGEEDDDPFAESTLEKANPNIDVSVSRKYLLQQRDEAKIRPSAKRSYIRYHVNRLTVSFQQAFPEEVWNKGSGRLTVKDRDVCYLGVDLGRSNDWAGVSAVFPQFRDGSWKYGIRSRSWACVGANPSIDYTQTPFSEWIARDLLGFQKSEVLDYTDLTDWILRLSSQYVVKTIAYDGTFAGDWATRMLNENSLPMFEFFQTFKRYTNAIKTFERELIAGNIFHACDPVLDWQAGNACTVDNARGEIMLDKRSSPKKIDAMVALMMAFSETIYGLQHDTGVGFVFVN